ncbi:Nitronate monooxygenase [Novymonas esmeraldas]|uniref:Nitronate monooxygenase n=1 Tax=Novymonas esmeraldas TaxID=1808958 RepID=A0AAW0EP84_9TRYP
MLGCVDMRLASAVARTGAIGGMPCSGMSAERLRCLLREHAGEAVCFNFFCHEPPPPESASVSPAWMAELGGYFAEEGIADPAAGVRRRLEAQVSTAFSVAQLEVLLEARSWWTGPLLVSFHFGLPPEPLWRRVRAAADPALCVCCSATTVAEAVYLRDRGVDVVVCQGAEAGGHRGLFLATSGGSGSGSGSSDVELQLGTFALVPQVRAALGPSACLVAAGGIVDAATARAALVLGADAVQVGTSFLRTVEATTSPVHRRALADAARSQAPVSCITNILSGRPARGLRNRLMAELGAMRGDAPPYPRCQPYLAELREAAEAAGRGDYSQLWAGQNLSGCAGDDDDNATTAADKVREIAAAFRVV